MKSKSVIGVFIFSSIVPVLMMGIVFYFSGQLIQNSINKPINNKFIDRQKEITLSSTILMSFLVGISSLLLTKNIANKLMESEKKSSDLVNKLKLLNPHIPSHSNQDLSMEKNLQIIDEYIENLSSLKNKNIFKKINTLVNSLKSSRTQEEALNIGVVQARHLLEVDRVIIFRYERNGEVRPIVESVDSQWISLLNSSIIDPRFENEESDRFLNRRCYTTYNIYQSDFSEDQIKYFESIAVKSNLAIALFLDEEIYGFLVADQCSAQRIWLQSEVDLWVLIAIEIESAVSRHRFNEKNNIIIQKTQQMTSLIQYIMSSGDKIEVLNKTVESVQKSLECDRVIVYHIDQNFSGSVVAESVLEGWPSAMEIEISDTCFTQAELYKKYLGGHIQVYKNIYAEKISECYLRQLEYFKVKSSIIVPILEKENLYGLLIIHQCSEMRNWQQSELEFLSQIKTQVSLALERIEVFNQNKKNIQDLNQKFEEYQKSSQLLREYISLSLTEIFEYVETLKIENQTQTEYVNTLDKKVNDLVHLLKHAFEATQESLLRDQSFEQLENSVNSIPESFIESQPLLTLEENIQSVLKHLNTMLESSSQIKLQAMNVTLEAIRMGGAGQYFAELGEQVHTLTRNLDLNIYNMQDLISMINQSIDQSLNNIVSNQEQHKSSKILLEEVHKNACQILTNYDQINANILYIIQFMETSNEDSLMQGIHRVLNQTLHINELTKTIDSSIKKMAEMNQSSHNS